MQVATAIHSSECHRKVRLSAGDRAGRRRDRGDVGQFQRIDRKAQKQENVQCQRHRGLCPVGERGAEIQGGAAALQEYIDTEQSKCHCHKVLHRILKLAGLPTDRENDRIEFFVLREYTPDQRRDIIRWALHEEQNIGLVIIDGIRDLIHDINSPSESLDIINELMRWSSYYELHIHTVLHLNKGDDNTRGHIGSELNNKAETILQISKSVENGRISEVRAMHIRDREFTPFAFEIGEDSLPRLVKDHQFKMSKRDRLSSYMDMTEQQHRTALEVAFPDNYVPGYQMLLDALKRGYDSIGYSRGRNTLVGLCKFLIQNEAIVKDGRGYAYNENFRIKNRSV